MTRYESRPAIIGIGSKIKMGEPLLRTKLNIPFFPRDRVTRPRLLSRLIEGLKGTLTLVIAPAGYGKTTLTAEATQISQLPVAWYSLDKADNRWERFFRYFVAALQQIDPRIGQDLPESEQAGQRESILTSLINDLDSLDEDCLLVLDDFQVMNNPAIHDSINFLLDHCPHGFHLLIAARSDPPFSLARLRARGQLVELRAADLRFSDDEASLFLNDIMKLNLETDLVGVLTDRTEGWAAGLQMASIAVQARLSHGDQRNAADFIRRFSGTNRYILDYLLEEVLANQSPEMQRFLLFTSIFERFCAPLCDEIFLCDVLFLRNASNVPAPVTSSSVYLNQLEKSNLFMVPLDDECCWYRYHPLFSDLLRSRLDSAYPGTRSQLHCRAAAWFEQEGLTVEAVNHALAGGANDLAARLVEENTTDLLVQGELTQLLHWVEVLPEDQRRLRPKLCIHQAYALAFAGKLQGVESLLQQAETAMSAQPFPESEVQSLRGTITAVRAMAALMSGRNRESIILARQARDLLSADQLWDLATTAWVTGFAERILGYLPDASSAFEEMVTLARQMGNIWTLVTGLMDLAGVLRIQGRLPEARALLEEALRESRKQVAHRPGYIARMETGLAHILIEQNDLAGAQDLLTDALERMNRWPNPNHLAYAYAVQTRLFLATGDYDRAHAMVEVAYRIHEQEPLVQNLRRMVEVNLVRYWLAILDQKTRPPAFDAITQTSSALVVGWRKEFVEVETDSIAEGDLTVITTLARIAIQRTQTEEAQVLLKMAINNATHSQNTSALIEALCLIAVTEQMAGHEREALAALEKALSLAQPCGMSRVFLDEGHSLHLLLLRWLAHSSAAHPLRLFVSSLLAQFEIETRSIPSETNGGSPIPTLPDPLTRREIEVLSLMAQGLTNAGIASQLFLSTGTIKAHTASIYRKLDVNNRTQAILRARQINLLP